MLVLPLTIFGFSGGTKTVICALRDRIAGAPVKLKKKMSYGPNLPDSLLTICTRTNLTLIPCIVVEHDGINVE